MRYEDFRREYTAGGLSHESLDTCPLRQFEVWLQQCVESQLIDPTAMVLATVEDTGHPWQRIVLFKGLSEGGFTFYTHYESDKACAIEVQPQVSLLFPWNALDRQVIVAGVAQKMSRAEAHTYFQSRPRESQVAALVSRQSRPIADRQTLLDAVAAATEKYAGTEVPTPEDWGGYRVTPQRIDFWQGGEHRLHDRFRYTRAAASKEGGWEITRLQP